VATALAGCVGNSLKSSQTPQPPVVAQIHAVVPASLTAGTGAVQLEITGTNFDKTTTVLWNGVARQTVFLNTGTLTAGISAADVANPGTVTISVTSGKYQSVSNGMTLRIMPAANPPPSGTLTSASYGSGIGSDGLGNTTIGPNENKVSYRIRVRHSGYISAIHPYLIMDHAGYAAGTGGKVLVSIQTDDGTPSHNPTGQKLTSSLLTDPYAAVAPARYFPVFTFSAPAAVSTGEIYHIVFENPDTNPTANFVSVDSLYQASAPTPSQPTMTDTDCAVLLYSNYWPDGSVWKPRQGYTPIVQTDYDDGFTEGYGYIEAWVGAPQSISGDGSVRETFTVNGTSKVVSSVGVRAARLSGSAALIVRLETGDGTLIEQGEIAATSMPSSKSPTYVWVNYKFSAPHTLASGQSYHLILQSSSSTVYQTFPIRKGVDYGYKNTTFFSDGYAQFQQAGNWVGWTQWGTTGRTDGDLQFYFGP
jgi:hypothetical protein